MSSLSQARALLTGRLTAETLEQVSGLLEQARREPAEAGNLRQIGALLEGARAHGDAWRESLDMARLANGSAYTASGASLGTSFHTSIHTSMDTPLDRAALT